MTKEEEIVRNVFDSYIRDLKAISTKKDRPTFDMLEEVKNKAIKALEQPTSDDCVSRQAVIDAVENTIAKYIPTFIGSYEKIPLELARAIKNVPPITPTHGTCKDCKYLLRDSPDCFCCRISWRRMTNEKFYCGNYEKREGEVVDMTREIWEERKNPPIDGKTDF